MEPTSTRKKTKKKMDVKAIADLSSSELYELVHHLRQCNESAQEETRRILQEQPEFARAIAQAQLKLGMIKQTTTAPQATGPVSDFISRSSVNKLY